MALQAQTRRPRQATAERWQAAAKRASDEGIQVRQVNSNGMWVATSGSDPTMAYLMEATNGIAHGCTCLAAQHDDPVCKHRAAYYLLIGVLVLDDDPEPDPPTPFLIDCQHCNGCGVHYSRDLERIGMLYPRCTVCGGSGQIAA